MSFIPVIATFVSVIVTSWFVDTEEALLLGLLVALVSSQWVLRGKFAALQRQIDRLREQLAALREQETEATAERIRTAGETRDDAVESAAEKTDMPAPTGAETPADEPAAATPTAAEPPPAAAAAPMPAVPAAQTGAPPTRAPNPVDKLEDLIRGAGNAIVSYFTDGNIFVRIGLLVLFFGVAFLLKFAAEHSAIPLEFRFIGAALGGLALLLPGWRLRLKKPVYALLLQGGGIGVIYITIFAAFRLADLLPPTLTFALLVFFSAFTVALSLLQDSRALAIYAVLGGFLAPFLASTGSGNYIGLFSYYAVLNAAVFALAWFRAWRALNLLGFVFTFGVFVLWVVFDYSNADLYPGLGFLALFFLLYSLIGVLYASRQPEHLTGYVDGTLVFGTPVIVSGLMMMMLRDYEFGIAGASAALGFYYIALARYAWRRVGAEFRLLAEALLAIGVVFATLAIPYALEGHWSSAAWALEAAGILWVSIRQRRFYAQIFAILLQVGSGVLFFLRNIEDVGDSAWLNPAFLGGSFIALGAFISARMLYLQGREFKLYWLHIAFYVWAMSWWLVSALVQIDEYVSNEIVAWLLLFGGTAAVLVYVDRIRGWNWLPASINAALLLPLLALISLYSLFQHSHVLVTPDLYFWVAAVLGNYWMITRLETVTWPSWVNLALHTGFVVFASLLLSAELLWLFEERFDAAGEGYRALLALAPLLALHLALQRRMPAIARLGDSLQLVIMATLALLLTLWSLVANLSNSGNPAPLPYLPLLNPLDLAHLAFFVLVAGGIRRLPASLSLQRRHILVMLGGLVFIWLTALLIRSMHHYLGLYFDLSLMLGDTRVQTAISILWTLIGMGAMLFASRRALRPLWIAGACLIGVVLVKMIFVDLGASGTVERIVSFLVVGSLLVATGYFSPIPERRRDPRQDEELSPHA